MKIIGHRGARGLAPENTIAALSKGLEHGADELEIDVRVTRDGIPVLHHDARIQSGNQKVSIVAYMLAELREHKPDLVTLDEALKFVANRAPVNTEVKPGEPVEPIAGVLRAHTSSAILLSSKSQQTLLALHHELPSLPTAVIEKWSGVRGAWRARELGTKRLHMRSWWLWSGFLKSMHRRGYQIIPYTINDPAKLAKWKPYLYGVITDYPNRFKK